MFVSMMLAQEVGLRCNIMSKFIQLGNNFALYVQLVHPLMMATASSCHIETLRVIGLRVVYMEYVFFNYINLVFTN